MKGNLRICKRGHRYYKSSDSPACPVCEEERKPGSGFYAVLSAPARRALENAGIKTLQQLSQRSRKEVLSLHGIGPASITKLEDALRSERLTFRDDSRQFS